MRRITLGEQGERLTARRRELGLTDDSMFDLARNDGRARTPEKRRLLALVEDEARSQGRPMWTVSNY